MIATLALLLGLSPTLQATEPALTAPEMFHALRLAGEDDPRAALAEAQRQLTTAQDAATRFWLLVAIARMHVAMEDQKASQEAFALAESVLASVPKAGAHMALWLQMESTPVAYDSVDPRQFGPRMTQLHTKVSQIGDPILSCSTTGWELWGLVSTHNYDEAWFVAEELERCAHSTGLRYLEAMALGGMGLIKATTTPPSAVAQEVLKFYDRALAALDGGSARWRRSSIEWVMGNALRRLKQFGPALEHLQRSVERSMTGVALA